MDSETSGRVSGGIRERPERGVTAQWVAREGREEERCSFLNGRSLKSALMGAFLK